MMKNLSIEWLKLKSYRTFWWLMGLFILCLIGSNYITYQLKIATSSQSHGTLDILMGSPFEFPDVWQTVSYVSSYVLFLPGFLMVILITNEYNFRTHRQNIIDGMRRSAFALTKILVAVLLSVFAAVLVFAITVLTGLIAGSSFSLTGSVYLLYFFLQALTYTLGGLLLGTLLKKSGLSIALYLIYIGFIKNLLALLLDKYAGGIGSYTPVKSSDELIPMPFFKAVTHSLITPPDTTWLLILTLIYLAGFYWLTLYRYKTQDL
ncbi:ABC-2 family transporter protein [Arachidicoccus rhizosphaerae]|jgi:ABC-type transport system involved in multi-copper enzyme maturation permease subunit|uniref:ABC-2 family transporter protein n=1 Tax=Arachidicoccus rhizosphaerae TaxID=551991 RepID=A0A1H4C918_9BACT|nr:ABC transporter permease [Arachidicoccus rhizosphaerae]SEA56843.1 ABC-2 family transporter protein [Arachidicoccus rhizosphaerae]